MTISELIKELRDIILVHPNAAHATVEGRTSNGRMGNTIAVRLKTDDHVVVIEAIPSTLATIRSARNPKDHQLEEIYQLIHQYISPSETVVDGVKRVLYEAKNHRKMKRRS